MTSCTCGQLAANGKISCTRCAMLHTLGLDHKANTAHIRQSYLTLVRRWHPDGVHGDERLRAQAGQKLAQINVAYSYLCRTPRPATPPPNRPSPSREPFAGAPTDFATRIRNADSASASRQHVAAIASFFYSAVTLLIIIAASTGMLDRFWEPRPPKPFASTAPRSIPRMDLTINPANVAGTYRGMTANTTRHKAASTLLLVQQQGNQISGCFIVAPPMQGSGPISGEIRKNLVIFSAKSPANSLLFVGTLSDDTISGSLVTTPRDQPQQSGEFAFSRSPKAKRVPENCPRDQDQAVASGRLTMP